MARINYQKENQLHLFTDKQIVFSLLGDSKTLSLEEFDECKTHILKPIFHVYMKLKSSIYCKNMESSSKFVFYRNLKKISKK